MSVDSRRPRSMAELSDALCGLSIAEMAALLRDVIERRLAEEPRTWVTGRGYVGFGSENGVGIDRCLESVAMDGGGNNIYIYTPQTDKETKANEH